MVRLVMVGVALLLLVPNAARGQGRARPGASARASAAGRPAPARVRRWFDNSRAARRAERLRAKRGAEHASVELTSEKYEQVKGAAKEILKTYPPDRYFYVGVGRSPSAVTELLQAVVPHQAQGFPVSGLSARAGQPISAQQLEEYGRHLDHFFPHLDRLDGRTILLMDTVMNGETLRKLQSVFEGHFAARGIDVRVETLSLKGESSVVDHKLSGKHDVLAAGSDTIARYDAHYIGRGETLGDLRPNATRRSFVRALVARLSEDASLDRFLRAGFREPLELSPTPARGFVKRHPDRGGSANLESEASLLQERLTAAFSGFTLFRGDAVADGPVTIHVNRGVDAGDQFRWIVESILPEPFWKPALESVDAALERFTGDREVPGNNRSVRITVRPDANGAVRDASQVTVERVPTPVPLNSSPTTHRVDREVVSEPGAEAEASAQAALARALRGVTFLAQQAPARSVRLKLQPERSVHGRALWAVRTTIPVDGWAPIVRAKNAELAELAYNALAPHHSYGLEIELRPDESGAIRSAEQLTVSRVAARVGVSDSSSADGWIQGTPKPTTSAGDPARELRRALARSFSGLSFIDRRFEPVDSVAFTLRRIRDRAGTDAWDVDAPVARDVWRPSLEAHFQLFEQLRQHPEPGNDTLRITLRPDSQGEIHTEDQVSIERLGRGDEVDPGAASLPR